MNAAGQVGQTFLSAAIHGRQECLPHGKATSRPAPQSADQKDEFSPRGAKFQRIETGDFRSRSRETSDFPQD